MDAQGEGRVSDCSLHLCKLFGHCRGLFNQKQIREGDNVLPRGEGTDDKKSGGKKGMASKNISSVPVPPFSARFQHKSWPLGGRS